MKSIHNEMFKMKDKELKEYTTLRNSYVYGAIDDIYYMLDTDEDCTSIIDAGKWTQDITGRKAPTFEETEEALDKFENLFETKAYQLITRYYYDLEEEYDQPL